MAQVKAAVPGLVKVAQTLNIAAVGANTKARQTFTVAGLTPEMIVIAKPKSDLTTGVDVMEAYCAANNTLTVVLWNSTAGSLTPGNTVFNILAL